VGVADSAAASDTLLQACRQCKPPVRLDPPQPLILRVQGKTLVVDHVLPHDGTLHQSGGVFYIRRGTHTVPPCTAGKRTRPEQRMRGSSTLT